MANGLTEEQRQRASQLRGFIPQVGPTPDLSPQPELPAPLVPVQQPAGPQNQAAQNFQTFATTGPSLLDFLGRGNTAFDAALGPSGRFDRGLNNLARDVASTGLLNIGAFGGRSGAGALPMGLASLAQLIFNQGRTDPAQMNLQLRDIARTGEARVGETQADLARAGLQGSGVGQAIAAAQRGSTANLRAQAIAADQAQAEARRRTDLQLLNDLILGPTLDVLAIERGQALGSRSLSQQGQNAMIGALGSIIPGIPGFFKKKDEG